jgi:hypothetical protein
MPTICFVNVIPLFSFWNGRYCPPARRYLGFITFIGKVNPGLRDEQDAVQAVGNATGYLGTAGRHHPHLD